MEDIKHTISSEKNKTMEKADKIILHNQILYKNIYIYI